MSCGYAIANGQWRMLGGAAYLFLVNSYFIFMSSTVVLALLRIPRERDLEEKEWILLRKNMIRNTIIILIPAAVFTFILAQ